MVQEFENVIVLRTCSAVFAGRLRIGLGLPIRSRWKGLFKVKDITLMRAHAAVAAVMRDQA